MTIQDIDHGWRRIQREIRIFASASVLVGFQGPEAQKLREGEITMVEIAAVHEFGSLDGTIPERSFLRATFDEKQADIHRQTEREAIRILDNKQTGRQAAERLGQFGVEIVRKRIRAGIMPPLKPATIARKGSSKPLIDTGQLIQSVTYVVRLNAQEVAFGG